MPSYSAISSMPRPNECWEVPRGIALSMSGRDYRMVLFHVVALRRLNELGYLPKLSRLSSVSGASVTAAVLGVNWAALGFDGNGIAQNFPKGVVDPVRYLASITIDQWAIGVGALTPRWSRRGRTVRW
jgi:NTE family protein